MPTCNECGTENPEGARFCYSCGKQVSSSARQGPYPISDQVELRDPVPTSSNLANGEIDKCLGHGERIIYSTSATVQVGNERMRAYVTNLRFLLYRRKGIVIQSDRLSEIELRSIGKTTMTEHG